MMCELQKKPPPHKVSAYQLLMTSDYGRSFPLVAINPAKVFVHSGESSQRTSATQKKEPDHIRTPKKIRHINTEKINAQESPGYTYHFHRKHRPGK